MTLDGARLAYQAVHLLMLNKPQGVITAATDARQETVMDLLPPLYRASECMPVGRLDKMTEGLLLLTNDGTLAHRILHPKRHIDKVYWARTDGPLDAGMVAAFAAGLVLSDFQTLPALLCLDPEDPCQATVIVREGKYHQVRRMFAACGRTVTELRRLSIGPVA
nr:pseudouridine synthase [Clostridia bacterium]